MLPRWWRPSQFTLSLKNALRRPTGEVTDTKPMFYYNLWSWCDIHPLPRPFLLKPHLTRVHQIPWLFWTLHVIWSPCQILLWFTQIRFCVICLWTTEILWDVSPQQCLLNHRVQCFIGVHNKYRTIINVHLFSKAGSLISGKFHQVLCSKYSSMWKHKLDWIKTRWLKRYCCGETWYFGCSQSTITQSKLCESN